MWAANIDLPHGVILSALMLAWLLSASVSLGAAVCAVWVRVLRLPGTLVCWFLLPALASFLAAPASQAAAAEAITTCIQPGPAMHLLAFTVILRAQIRRSSHHAFLQEEAGARNWI